MERTKILGVVGSLREHSYTRKLMRVILKDVLEEGGEPRLLDLREAALTPFNPDQPHDGPAYGQIKALVEWADGFILASPDYHGGMSASMKNFLDYFWGEFSGKLVGYVVASHEKGLTVQDQMRTVVRQCYGWSLPYGIGFNGSKDFDAAGNLASERLTQRARMLARDMVVYGRLLHEQFQADLASEPSPPSFALFLKP